MAAYVKTLVDSAGNQILPRTNVGAVDGLQSTIDNIKLGAAGSVTVTSNGNLVEFTVKNMNGSTIGTAYCNLNVASVVATAEYNSTNDTLDLTFNGVTGTVSIPAGDITGALTPTNTSINGKQLIGAITIDASEISYSNSVSGITATTVQGAIDELSAEKASKEEVDSLSSTISEYLVQTDLGVNATYQSNKRVDIRDGVVYSQNNYRASSFIDITGCEKIIYSRLYTTASNTHGGIAFYDENQTFIDGSGISCIYKAGRFGLVLSEATVPNGAKYVRCTTHVNLGNVEVYNESDYNSKLPIAVNNIKTDIDIDNDYLNAYKELINNYHSLVDYGYNNYFNRAKNSSASDSTVLGIKRYGPVIELNLDGIDDVIIVRVNGEIETTVINSTVDSWTNGLALREGKRYKASIKSLSDTNRINALSIGVYVCGTHNSVGNLVATDFEAYREFIATDAQYNICLYIGKNAVFENFKCIVLLEELADESGIEDYYSTEMEDTVAKVRSELTSPALVFPWITDIHRYSNNAAVQTFDKMIANMKYLVQKVPCNFIINTGDLTDGNLTQEETLARSNVCMDGFMGINCPYLFAIGNHDENYVGGSDQQYLFTQQECYKAYFASSPRTMYNANENGMDYYIDYNDLGIRFIVLCANNVSTQRYGYSFGTSTAAWLSGALNTDKKVIVSLHQSPYTAQVYNNQSTKNAADVRTALEAFVNNGGSLVMISGHSHCDIAFINPFLSIMEECQRFTTRAEDVESYETTAGITGFIDCIKWNARASQTSSEDLWSVCVYKPDSSEFSLIRFGAGTDRYFHITPIAPTTVTTKLTGTITWSSSDTSVATVSSGVITGVAIGKCAVLAKDETGNYECWIIEVT